MNFLCNLFPIKHSCRVFFTRFLCAFFVSSNCNISQITLSIHSSVALKYSAKSSSSRFTYSHTLINHLPPSQEDFLLIKYSKYLASFLSLNHCIHMDYGGSIKCSWGGGGDGAVLIYLCLHTVKLIDLKK